jgi:anti-sigma-K factor RskA
MSDHDEMEQAVAAWVLGAVEAEESENLRLHVATCPTCRVLAGRLRRAVEALPLEVNEVNPPERLRSRILEAAATNPRPSQRMAGQAPRKRVSVLGVVASRVPAYAAAAAVVLALGAGWVWGTAGHRPPAAPASQVSRYTLTGSKSLAGATASVVVLSNQDMTLVDFAGLPPLQAGRVYELWLITKDGRADASGVFDPGANGTSTVIVNKTVSGYVAIAVTTEAAPNGSSAPTELPEMVGSLI